MQLSARDRAMLDGAEGDAARDAMAALIQLGEAYDAPDMVDIGYAHVHAGMALYKGDVELIETTAQQGARMLVPVSTNIANADMGDWQGTGAPDALGLLQKRAEAAHRAMGSATSFTCTPYWAGTGRPGTCILPRSKAGSRSLPTRCWARGRTATGSSRSTRG